MGEHRGGVDWHLRLVGILEVVRAGTLERHNVGSRKARTLVAMLGARQGRVVGVDHIVEELWGTAPPRQPEANVATLVSRLRARFGRRLIIGGRSGYRLGDTARVDLYEAAAQVGEAEARLRAGQPASGLRAAEHVLDLLGGGPALADHPIADWAEEARTLQAGLLRRAWHAAAEGALHTGNPARAQVLAETAITVDPLDEVAYRMLMRACAAAGEPARAIMTYQRLRGTLATELGTDPAPATRDLHVAILRANALTTPA
ncbi:MAG TPA: BTAD domain-containing putative transcriptional regulator [Actinophytocola sp.]|uniref:AfsR/SARP family transcriptional regulator n=1 Tax=Actinophytocola sp. TaxID=1872138 RepID=UPI002DDC9AAB|nr:BTAD domain-containing putative transcriptional regulator [Actinophytocola sp.]HEV2783276.1 BTAD domain-containing putative transcriptional regulator [Actinophytocola sp.]